MNPKDSAYDVYDRCDAEDEILDKGMEKIRQLERQIAQQKAKESAARSKAANKALNDLCDALGVNLVGASINAGTGHIHIPNEQVQMIANRIAAMTEANALIEGAL